MSEKLSKNIRKQVNKKAAAIKKQGLQEWIDFIMKQSFKKRFVFAMRVIFKRLKP